MGSGQSNEGLASIRNAVQVVKKKHRAHPEADDLQSLQVAQEEVRGLRALVLQMSKVIITQHEQVLGQYGGWRWSVCICVFSLVYTNLCPRERLHFNFGAHTNNRFPTRNCPLHWTDLSTQTGKFHRKFGCNMLNPSKKRWLRRVCLNLWFWQLLQDPKPLWKVMSTLNQPRASYHTTTTFSWKRSTYMKGGWRKPPRVLRRYTCMFPFAFALSYASSSRATSLPRCALTSLVK